MDLIFRYFVGKLLEVKGLVRTYTNAFLEVINNSQLIIFKELIKYDIQVNFKDIELLKYLYNKNKIDIFEFSFM